MSRDEIRRVFRDLYDEGLRFVLVQGGEPMIRRDLLDILEDLHGMGFQLALITNGTRFTESNVRRLAGLDVSISVSLDSLVRDRYESIRGADQLRRVLAGVELLENYPHPKYLTCIVSDKNRDEAVEICRFARAHGFMPVVGAYHWDIDRYGKITPELQYETDAALTVFRDVLASKLIPAGYFREFAKDNERWLKGEGLPPCDAGRYSIAIDSSGNVAPCLALPHGGNLLKSRISEILDRMDRQAIKQCSDRSSCNMLCSRIVGTSLRRPLTALRTPRRVQAGA
jgi:MoaA/NifB/PqqE/SkfB family radical SAM enzyme